MEDESLKAQDNIRIPNSDFNIAEKDYNFSIWTSEDEATKPKHLRSGYKTVLPAWGSLQVKESIMVGHKISCAELIHPPPVMPGWIHLKRLCVNVPKSIPDVWCFLLREQAKT